MDRLNSISGLNERCVPQLEAQDGDLQKSFARIDVLMAKDREQ